MDYRTRYPHLAIVLDTLLKDIKEKLSANFTGFYLQGSLATGGFDRDSDVDFIVVSESDLTESEITTLQKVHADIFKTPINWAQHLEGSYFPKDTLRHASNAGTDVWYLEHGKNHLVKSPHCNTVVVRWILRERPFVVDGANPQTLIDPISTDNLRRAIYADTIEWGQEILDQPDRFANRFYQSFIVLNLCRMLRDLYMGEIGSKRLGTDWAMKHLDSSWSGLIDRAWDGRPNPAVSFRQPADEEEFEMTLKFVREVLVLGDRAATELGIR